MTFISFLDCLIFAVTMFAGAYILVWCDIAMNGGLEDEEYGREGK
jgi:hypothetical protein